MADEDDDIFQESPRKKAVWLTAVTQRLPVGTRVRIKASDVPEYIGRTGRVADYDTGAKGEWPLVGVCFDPESKGTLPPRAVFYDARRDGFYDDELEVFQGDPMHPNKYQQLALRTETTPDFINPAFIEDRLARGLDGGLDAKQLGRLMHAFMGGSTESGEGWDMLKKAFIYGRPFDKTNVREEAGDELWYIALALDACGYTLEDAMERNIAKLKARYPNGFNEENANKRDLEKEQAVLGGATVSDIPSHVEIARLSHRFDSLMQDPHPGLSTWLDARRQAALELRNALDAVLG